MFAMKNACSYFSSVILDDTDYTMRGHSTESKPSHAAEKRKDNGEDWGRGHEKKKAIG